MNATRKHSLRAGVAVAALLLLLTATSPAAASGDHDHDRGHGRGRYQRYSGRTWAPPLPAPPMPRGMPRALPRARVFVAPHAIHLYRASAYSPYFAGRVFYAPYQCYLDVYYFPVAIGPQIVYQPYYYLNGELFYGFEAGTPRFFFSLRF